MSDLVFASMDTAYHVLFDYVKKHGQPFGPRGKKCIEIRPFSFTIIDPQSGIFSGRSRRLNYRFMAVETLLYLAGTGGQTQSSLILDTNPSMRFALNPETGCFDGAYGTRLVQSLEHIESLLKRDPDTRQAVASIWAPHTGVALDGSRDLPCTCLLHFYKTGYNNLSLSVYMRSNDLNWGVPYDVAAFTMIQVIMAAALNMGVGEYNHTAGSLHYYEVGNSDGEKPPTIAYPEDEEWIDDVYRFFRIAEKSISMSTVIQHAGLVAEELLTHRKMGGTWRSFEPHDTYCEPVKLLIQLMKYQHPKTTKVWKDEVTE